MNKSHSIICLSFARRVLAAVALPVMLSISLCQRSRAEDPAPASMLIKKNGFSPVDSHRRWLSTPVCRLDDGRLMTLTDNGLVFSSDEMASWSEPLQILEAEALKEHKGSAPSGGGTLCAASGGNWVVAWRDDRKPDSLEAYWNRRTQSPVPTAAGAVWAIFSTDKGKTWAAPQKVLDKPGGYPPKQILETKAGTLIMPVQYHTKNPGRNVIVPLYSNDQGKTWIAPDGEIDVGGCGNHDGALEPTLVQLKDGRVWLVFRTNLDSLWQSFSDDEGKTWSTPKSTRIAASSSPPYVGRLSNGKLLLLWNPVNPTDGSAPLKRRGGDDFFSEKAASWYRQELLLATSENEGKSWSKPVIVARHPKKSGRIAYAYFCEDKKGNVLIFANQGKIQSSIPLARLP